jgi:hypothetical protein
MEERFQPARR